MAAESLFPRRLLLIKGITYEGLQTAYTEAT